MRLKNFIVERFPESQKIWSLYAVIVCLLYSWTLITSFYQFPSWLFYLTMGQIASIYAYSLTFNLLESIAFLLLLLLVELVLFLPWKRDDTFLSRSLIIVFLVLGSSMLRLLLFSTDEDIAIFLRMELTWWIYTFLLGLPLVVFLPGFKPVRKFLEGFAERARVFLYIYLPLSLLSIAVVVIRNIY